MAFRSNVDSVDHDKSISLSLLYFEKLFAKCKCSSEATKSEIEAEIIAVYGNFCHASAIVQFMSLTSYGESRLTVCLVLSPKSVDIFVDALARDMQIQRNRFIK